MSPLPTLNWGTDTVRNRTSCIHCTSLICPAHGCVMRMRPGELKAHMEKRSRTGPSCPLSAEDMPERRAGGQDLSLDSLAEGSVHPLTLSPAPFPARQTHGHPTGSPRRSAVGPDLNAWCSGRLLPEPGSHAHSLAGVVTSLLLFFPLVSFLIFFPCCPNFFFFSHL